MRLNTHVHTKKDHSRKAVPRNPRKAYQAESAGRHVLIEGTLDASIRYLGSEARTEQGKSIAFRDSGRQGITEEVPKRQDQGGSFGAVAAPVTNPICRGPRAPSCGETWR